MAFFHGITVLESTSGTSPGFDFTPPRVTSALAASVLENAAWSMELAADKPVTFAKRDGADSSRFGLSGSTLSLPAQDYEGGQTQFVCNLAAVDASANVRQFSVAVSIGDVFEIALAVTSPFTGTVDENSAYGVMLSATKPVTFTKRPGADSDAFVLAGASLSLAPKNFEAGKTLFVCNLRATDADGGVIDFAHAVTIRDVYEAPLAITSAATGSVNENSAYAATLSANREVVFSKRAGADGDAFTLQGASLSLPPKDYEAGKTTFTCNLRATDIEGATVDFAHVVTILDVGEATVAFAVPTLSVTEGNVGTKTASAQLIATRNTVVGPLVVALAYGGTAAAGVDYTGPASVTIPDGAISVALDLAIIGNTGVQPNRTIVVTASYGGSVSELVVTITDDDTLMPALPASATIAFGGRTRVGHGGHKLGYTGSGFLKINGGNAAEHWQILDNQIVPKNGSGAYHSAGPAFAGPYSLTIAEYSDSQFVNPTGLTQTLTINILPNAAHIAPGSATNPDAADITTNGSQLVYLLASSATRISLGDTIWVRSGEWTVPQRIRPGTSYPGTAGQRITVRSEVVDTTVDADGNPNNMHGALMMRVMFDSAVSGDILLPIDFRQMRFRNNAMGTTTGISTLLDYASAGYGIRAYDSLFYSEIALNDKNELLSVYNSMTMRSGPAGTPEQDAVFQGNRVRGLRRGVEVAIGAGQIRGNYFELLRSDGVILQGGSTKTVVEDNVFGAFHPWGGSGANDNDHPDVIQHTGRTASSGSGPIVRRNVYVAMPENKSAQGIFFDDTVDPHRLQDAVVENNIVLTKYVNALVFTRCDNPVARYNLGLGPVDQANASKMTAQGGGAGGNFTGNIVNATSITSQTGTMIDDNLTVAKDAALYTGLFPNWNQAAKVRSLAQARAAFRPVAGKLVSQGGAMRPDGTYHGPVFPNGAWNDGAVYAA